MIRYLATGTFLLGGLRDRDKEHRVRPKACMNSFRRTVKMFLMTRYCVGGIDKVLEH